MKAVSSQVADKHILWLASLFVGMHARKILEEALFKNVHGGIVWNNKRRKTGNKKQNKISITRSVGQ